MNFVVIRLGKDSVADIEHIDSFKNGSNDLHYLEFTCRQVEEAIVERVEDSSVFCFIYLGSDNNKGLPTNWEKGIRALGKIEKIEGRENFQSEAKISIEIFSIFPKSYNSITFLERTSELYQEFSQYPVIGLQSSRNNAIQYAKGSVNQSSKALLNAINHIYPQFRLDLMKNAGSLVEFLHSEESGIEGYELESEEISHTFGWGSEYPLNTVLIRTEQRTVGNIVDRIKQERFKLDPDFQRDFVWAVSKQSKLIESCLMRIPLPVFYVAEDSEGKIVVVDGLQRLTTFCRYLNNEFSLKGIYGTDLNGKRFNELSIKLQERIEDTQLILYILDEKAPERAKLDIFDRVNGGTPLTRQQMRNCLYNGKGTRLLRKLSKKSEFLIATGNSLSSKSMRDREVINRFLAFSIFGYDSYRGDMDEFLARALKVINQMTDDELQHLEDRFLIAMCNNKKLFNEHAFRKSLFGGSIFRSRSVLNISLFDVFSYVLSLVDLNDVDNSKLKNLLEQLIEDDEFHDAITIGTNSTRKVKNRFSKAITVMELLR